MMVFIGDIKLYVSAYSGHHQVLAIRVTCNMHKPRDDVEISSSLSLACVCEAKFGGMSIAPTVVHYRFATFNGVVTIHHAMNFLSRSNSLLHTIANIFTFNRL